MPRGSNKIDRTGQQFGRLTAIEYAGFKKRRSLWLCRCECGNKVILTSTALVSGNTKSCGCMLHDPKCNPAFRHGDARRGNKTPEYRSYMAAKTRCVNPNHPYWERYGGRGIEFRFDSFEEFLNVVGRRPTLRHSIERINRDGHYEAGNVKWATSSEQARNRHPKRWRKRPLLDNPR